LNKNREFQPQGELNPRFFEKMKWFIALTVLVAVVSAADTKFDVCHDSTVKACSATGGVGSVACDSLLGGFIHSETELQSYVNSLLATSYDYLLMGTHFNSFQKNRPGFEKLLKGLSDRAWSNTIDLIKHISKRGGKANFSARHEVPSTISHNKNKLEVDELHALALALDSEKKLTTEAIRLHRRVSRLDNHDHYDPEIAHYLDEKILEDQAETVRKLSGYTNDLAQLVKVSDPSLNVFLFDEYLQKQ